MILTPKLLKKQVVGIPRSLTDSEDDLRENEDWLVDHMVAKTYALVGHEPRLCIHAKYYGAKVSAATHRASILRPRKYTPARRTGRLKTSPISKNQRKNWMGRGKLPVHSCARLRGSSTRSNYEQIYIRSSKFLRHAAVSDVAKMRASSEDLTARLTVERRPQRQWGCNFDEIQTVQDAYKLDPFRWRVDFARLTMEHAPGCRLGIVEGK